MKTVLTAVLIEAFGGMEFSRQLTPFFQEIALGYPEIQARMGKGVVVVKDRGHITTRGVDAARMFPVVVESVTVSRQAAKVEFRPQ